MYQEAWCARANLLFCQSNPIAFLQFSLPSPSSLLKLPIVNAFVTDAWAKLLQTNQIRKSKMGHLFQTLICLLTSERALSRSPGKSPGPLKVQKANVVVKYFYNIVHPYSELLFLLSLRQSPIYIGFLFATAQVESWTAMIFFCIYFLIAYLTKIPPVKEAFRYIGFVRWFRKGNMLSMCLQ